MYKGVEKIYLVSVLQDNDPTGRKAEEVLDVILADHGVQVHAVHVEPLHLLKVSVLRLAGHQAHQPPVRHLVNSIQFSISSNFQFHLDSLLHLLSLSGVESELRDISWRVSRWGVVAKLGCKNRKS